MKQYFIPYIYITFFLWNFGLIYGQKLKLTISVKDSVNVVFINSINYQKKHNSKISLLSSLDSVKTKLSQKGFLNFSVDTVVKDSLYYAEFDLGKIYKVVRVYYSDKDITENQLRGIIPSLKENYFDVQIENLPYILNKIVTIFESQGNTFTQVSLKNINVKKGLVEGQLNIKKSSIRKIDKIVINGYNDFPKSYLKHYLKLKTNTLFTKHKLTNLSKLINSLSFVTETKAPEILFTNDSTIVYLYMKKKSSNNFDGLLGFSSKENGKGILFNGYFDLSLYNIFNNGESFSIYWKNNGDNRQTFSLNATIPYLFNSKFSPKVELNIYKQDSSFINTKTKFLIPFSINEKHSIGISLQTENSSNLLIVNNQNINNFNTTLYGVNYNLNITNNHILFPTKFNLFSEVLFGKRKTNNNNSTPQSILYFKANYLWSLNYKNHIFLQNQSSIFSSDNILTNEIFRIGGSNSIRGFNEESIFASTYSYFNIEYRFNPTTSSYLYSITDIGYINNNIANKSSKIYSLGVGYAFKAKLGLVNLSYALGKLESIPFNINNSRFHIKIISFF